MGSGMTEPEEYIHTLHEQIQVLMLEKATIEEKLKMAEKALDMANKLKDSYRDLLHKCEGLET